MPEIVRMTKSADKEEVCLGSVVNYTIVIENIITEPLLDPVFRDQLPPGLSFQAGSVTINNIPNPNANPVQGISLPTIAHGGVDEIRFSAIAANIPTTNPVINIANLDFRYRNEDDEIVPAMRESNQVPVLIEDCSDCEEGFCDRNICRMYAVSQPFTVRPFVRRENPGITCIGETNLVEGITPCPSQRREFEYTLTQRVRVELPLAFGAEVCYDES